MIHKFSLQAITFLLIFSVLVTSCAITSNVNKYGSWEEYFEKINKYNAGEQVYIVTKSGITFSGVNVFVKPDTTTWQNVDSPKLSCKLPTIEIEKIFKTQKTASAIQGFLIGSGIALTAGLGYYFTSSNSSAEKGWFMFGVIVLAGLTGLIGLILGLTTDAPIVYDLRNFSYE